MKTVLLYVCLASLIVGMAPRSGGQSESKDPPARAQLGTLRRALHEARDKGDWETYKARSLDLSALLNGSPNSLFDIAVAEIKLGHTAEARAQIQHVLDMGQANEQLGAAPFDVFHDLGDAVAENRKPITRASLMREIPDTALLPEDIDYDSATKRFFFTSVLKKKIVVVDAAGKDKDFAVGPDGWPMLGLKVDAKRRRLWATDVALDDYSIAPKADWGRSALLCYDLDKGTLLFRIEGPEHSALGDMVLLPDGNPVVSDGAGGGIYRMRSDRTLERLDGGEFISPQTPAIDAEAKHLFVPDYLRGIGVLDLSTRQVRWIAMNNKYAFNGIDGLYLHHDTLLAVQNGSSPERVVAFVLDSAHEKVISQNIIESSTPRLGDPTHGVIVGADFYYIANSGWDSLDEHGVRTPSAKVTPPRVMRMELKD